MPFTYTPKSHSTNTVDVHTLGSGSASCGYGSPSGYTCTNDGSICGTIVQNITFVDGESKVLYGCATVGDDSACSELNYIEQTCSYSYNGGTCDYTFLEVTETENCYYGNCSTSTEKCCIYDCSNIGGLSNRETGCLEFEERIYVLPFLTNFLTGISAITTSPTPDTPAPTGMDVPDATPAPTTMEQAPDDTPAPSVTPGTDAPTVEDAPTSRGTPTETPTDGASSIKSKALLSAASALVLAYLLGSG